VSECVFCRIASGGVRSEIIYEDDQVIGLMEHFPYFEDLPDAIASRIIHLGQRLSRAMKALYGVPRVAFLFTGGDLAHAHAHVVPLHEKTDITSLRYITGEVARAPSEELAATAALLRSVLNR